MARMKCHTSRWNKSGHEITNSQSALECTCAGHERREEREKKVSFGSQVAGAFFWLVERVPVLWESVAEQFPTIRARAVRGSHLHPVFYRDTVQPRPRPAGDEKSSRLIGASCVTVASKDAKCLRTPNERKLRQWPLCPCVGNFGLYAWLVRRPHPASQVFSCSETQGTSRRRERERKSEQCIFPHYLGRCKMQQWLGLIA